MLHTGAGVQRAMFTAFQELELIEKVTADVKLSDEQAYHLTSFHALNEEKFAGLDGAALDRLHRAGFLRLAVFVLSSLRNVGRLIDLKNRDRKSTRLNSSHVRISYAVFCLKKKK